MSTYTEKTVFVTLGAIIRCGSCGISFAFDEHVLKQRQRDGQRFYCPNGCPRVYRETEEDRLRKRLEEERQQAQARVAMLEREAGRIREERDHNARRATAYKGHLTRTKKRVGHGVCPCCNRSFKDLARHMHDKHPEYADN